MNDAAQLADIRVEEAGHFGALIVGAGISGVGGAYHLLTQCPGTAFVVLEAQESFGGTWRTHRYPGIRSDSDLYTFGYRFQPWTGPPIADAARDPELRGRGHQKKRPRLPYSLSSPDDHGTVVESRQSLDA